MSRRQDTVRSPHTIRPELIVPSPGPGAAYADRPWLALAAHDAVEIRRPLAGDVRRAPADTMLVLVEDRPLARARLRRLAARTGLVVERELLVLPSITSPVVVVDDEESAVRWLWQQLATVPPGVAGLALPASAALGIARSLPWQWTGALTPGRVVLGRRE